MFFSTVASQYFVGSGCPTGHSINSVSSPRFAAPLIGAVRTRTRAKRERSRSFVPSRQVIVRQACFGRLSANSLTLRRRSGAEALRPHPLTAQILRSAVLLGLGVIVCPAIFALAGLLTGT